jgi:hypothetical protein
MNPPKDDPIDPQITIEPTPDAEKVITVEVVKPTALDGRRIPVGKIVKISVEQWRALSRHFKWVDGPPDHAPQGWMPPAPAASPVAK